MKSKKPVSKNSKKAISKSVPRSLTYKITVVFIVLIAVIGFLLSPYLFIQASCSYRTYQFNNNQEKYISRYLGFTILGEKPYNIEKSSNEDCLVSPGGELVAEYKLGPTDISAIRNEVNENINHSNRSNNMSTSLSICSQYYLMNKPINKMNYQDGGNGIGKDKNIYYMINYILKDQNILNPKPDSNTCVDYKSNGSELVDKVVIRVSNIPIK